MEKIYFAGKFNIDKTGDKTLENRLVNDYRAKVLGNSKKLTYAQRDVRLSNGHIYSGPFYCEQASNGDFTSTDCNTVLDEEYKAVKNADIYIL